MYPSYPYLTHILSASEMTYIVSSGALNSTHSLTHMIAPSNTVTDDVTNYVTQRIFNTNLW